ncbi:MAG: hypothetical protein GX228_06795 [Firmicutes bacterium]|nr:hypothetical protein [Bacillota bacterium]NLL88619.1 hypothetical protein [Bacillota bacterium]HKM17342.1 hypothetical protein [Limnochordia bacterium]
MLKKIGHFLKITTLAYIIYSLMISAFNITRFSVREFSLTSLVLDFAVWVVAWIISSFFLERWWKK